MSQIVLTSCTICKDGSFPLDQFLFFSCGHKVCRKCIEHEKFVKDPLCHECRQPKGRPHRIYLSLDEIVEEQRHQVVGRLNQIDTDTPAESIEKAGKKILRLHSSSGGDPETSKALLEAATNMQERLAPLAALYAEQRQENEVLQARLRELQCSEEAHKKDAEQAREYAKSNKAEKKRYRERAEGYLSKIKRQEVRIAQLKEDVEEKDKTVGLLNTKMKLMLKAEKRRSSARSHEQDTSLQIEGKPEITPPKKIKRKRPAPPVLQDLNADTQRHQGKRRKSDTIPFEDE